MEMKVYNEINEMMVKEEMLSAKRDEIIENFGHCYSCNEPSSFKGKLYWYSNILYCKECLIDALISNNVVTVEYGNCSKCKNPSSMMGKLYKYTDKQNRTKVYCKYCLIEKLVEDKVIFDNWFSNFD